MSVERDPRLDGRTRRDVHLGEADEPLLGLVTSDVIAVEQVRVHLHHLDGIAGTGVGQ